jgi:hypothetical protein
MDKKDMCQFHIMPTAVKRISWHIHLTMYRRSFSPLAIFTSFSYFSVINFIVHADDVLIECLIAGNLLRRRITMRSEIKFYGDEVKNQKS